MLSSIGGIVYTLFSESKSNLVNWYTYLFYFIHMVGEYGACINTALIGVSLCVITKCHSNWLLRINFYLNLAGLVTPLAICGVVVAVKYDEMFIDGIIFYPFLSFKHEYYVLMSILAVCTLTTIVSMIVSQRQYKKYKLEKANISDWIRLKQLANAKRGAMSEIQFPNLDNSENNMYVWDDNKIVCRVATENHDQYKYSCQVMRHTICLICLTFSMIVGESFY